MTYESEDTPLILDRETDGLPKRLYRQSLIETVETPNSALDYLCQMQAKTGDDHLDVHLTYVPDRLIISSQSFGTYLHCFSQLGHLSLEQIAHYILEDLNDEMVPRWLQVIVSADASGLDRGHKTLLEDCQPSWNNPMLLARVKGLTD
jgi:7-cyano-7-deazaguanine reductase